METGMDFQQLINSITPEAYENLKRAVELGKWPDGVPLTPAQKEHCLQAVIAYDEKHKMTEERVGFIHTKKHSHCGSDGEDPFASQSPAQDPATPKPLKWSE